MILILILAILNMKIVVYDSLFFLTRSTMKWMLMKL